MNYTPRRRGFLQGSALFAGALFPLAACAGRGGTDDASDPDEGARIEEGGDPNNPFGLDTPSRIDAAIFNGGYGVGYTEYAGAALEERFDGADVEISKTQDVTKELQPRFAGGDPPDVMVNSGSGRIGLSAIIGQIEDLSGVIDSQNYEGDIIRDTLYPGALEAGMVDGKLAVINYVLTVFGLWYSSSLFEANGWEPPKTWDDAIALGAQAKDKGKYLFVWGQEAADYYMELAISSAIKEGGHEVRLGLDNLEADCWRHPALQAVFSKIEEIVSLGYIKPGGGGTQFTAAQAAWSQAQEALLYPAGSFIGNEMSSQTAEGFEMMAAPAPTVSESPMMPFEAIHSSADNPFVVPSQGKNVAGGKEFMRAMLSKDAASNFSREVKSSTIVKDTVPEDGFGSSSLVSQLKMLSEAGDNVFTWRFDRFYGMGPDLVSLWNSFLDGQLTTEELTARSQQITDAIREDDAIEKYVAE